MIFNMVGVGGGSSTTKIINVESKADLPEKASPGSIAIISGAAPGEVYVQGTEPESPADGDLWLTTSSKSRVIYIQKGTPYPIDTIQQYVDGAWVTCANYQYIDGAWSKELYILKGGDLCTEITGGWTYNETQGISVANGQVRLYNTSGADSADGVFPGMINSIDLSDYYTLYWNVTSATWTKDPSNDVNVCELKASDQNGNEAINYRLSSTGLHTIDVSALTGKCKISFRLYSYHANAIDVYTDGLWLE